MESASSSDKYSGAPAGPRPWRVQLVLRPSPMGRAFVVLAVLATVALAPALPLEGAGRALPGLAALFAGLRAARRLGAATAAVLDSDGRFAVRDRAGAWIQGVRRPGSFVSPWLTVARWRPEGARFDRTLLLLPDMAGREALRRARLILRWS